MNIKQFSHLSISALYCVLLMCLAPIAAFAQDPFVPAEATVEKIDGRFKTKIRTDNVDAALAKANRFVRKLDVHIEWWGLLGQPVEIYGLKWERGDTYYVDGETLKRSAMVQDHPDLVARYDDLQPSNIEVAFDVEFYAFEKNGLGWDGTKDANAIGENYYNASGGDATATKITNNLLIAKSGKFMMDFSPSSPRDWKSFIDWSSYSTGVSSNVQDLDIGAQNTFKAAKRIRFRNLRINEITMPDASARNILEEFKRREKKENDGEKSEDTKTQDKDSPSKKQTSADDEADFWGDGKSTKTASKTSSEDDFWGAAPDSTKSKDQESVKVESDDDYWSNPSNSKTESGAKGSNSQSEGDFWSSPDDAENQTYEIIKNDDNKTGVVASNGEVLIPFRRWEILSYRDGLAKVSIIGTLEPGLSRPKCEGGKLTKPSVSVWVTETGLVQSDGEWLIPPTKNAAVKLERNNTLFLRSCPRSGCGESTTSSDRAERVRQCRPQFERFKDQLSQRGYKLL